MHTRCRYHADQRLGCCSRGGCYFDRSIFLSCSEPILHKHPLAIYAENPVTQCYGYQRLCSPADNWLLGADQQTLVLTDFGSAVDALRPEGRAGSSWHATPTPAAPVPPFDAPAAAVAARPNPGEATVAGRVSSPCRSAQATGSTAVGPAARGEAGEESSLASTVRRFDPESKPSSDSVAEGVDPASRARKRRRFCGGGEDQQGGESARGNGKEKDKPAEGCSMRLSEKLVFPYSNYLGTGAPAFVAPELARAWREKSVLDFRHSDVGPCVLLLVWVAIAPRVLCMYHILIGVATFHEKATESMNFDCSSVSRACSPLFLLACQVFSVGLCMYRMLRPDSVDIDNGTGLEGKGKFRRIPHTQRAGRHGCLWGDSLS